jgi:copper homeostasis protein
MKGLLLEVIVQTVEDAREAARGGANRLEVVRAIDQAGLTPSLELVRNIAREVPLPLRVIVRANAGYMTDPLELGGLRTYCARLGDLGVDGVVIGFADAGRLRLDLVRSALAETPEIRATFHRAFDTLRQPLEAIDELCDEPRIDRVLTSGGDGSAQERGRQLARLAGHAGGRLTIIAGSNVDKDVLATFAEMRCVTEVHVGRAARLGSDPNGPVLARLVRDLRAICDAPS